MKLQIRSENGAHQHDLFLQQGSFWVNFFQKVVRALRGHEETVWSDSQCFLERAGYNSRQLRACLSSLKYLDLITVIWKRSPGAEPSAASRFASQRANDPSVYDPCFSERLPLTYRYKKRFEGEVNE